MVNKNPKTKDLNQFEKLNPIIKFIFLICGTTRIKHIQRS